jgi:pimeloyl-ACP methyl ester carboxylesterase
MMIPGEKSGVARVEAFGERKEVWLGGWGVIRYREVGEGAPVVFLHGLLVNGDLWREVVPVLSGRYRCIVPDLPLGSHAVPMNAGAELSPPGLARLVGEFMDALDLRGVTLVGNDTGGAICQLVVAWHPERLARLVLTNCDAFENFLPPLLRPFQYGARLPGFAFVVAQLLRLSLVRSFFIATVSHRRVEPAVADSYFSPVIRDPGVRRDVTKVLRGISNRYTLEAAEFFPGFHKPVLLVWGEDDFFFPFRFAERLRGEFPDARLEQVSGSRAFVPEDRPELLAGLIGSFLGTRSGVG